MTQPPPVVDRDVAARTEALLRRYASWPPAGAPAGAGAALVQAFAHIAGVVADRVNRVPDKNLHAFLEMIGVRPAPPQPARVPLTFTLAAGATTDAVVPAGTRVAAVAGEGGGDPPVFETERDLVVTAARLAALRTLDPARDRFADHGTGSAPFGAFSAIAVTDHRLYVGSEMLFGIAETADVRLRMSPVPIDARWPWLLAWERWDGAAWVPVAAQVQRVNQSTVDTLMTVRAVPGRVVGATSSRWLRARLQTSIPRLGGPGDDADRVRVEGLPPDALTANQAPAPLTRPFSPFVVSKRLLVRCDEAFSKAGAKVVLTVALAAPGAPSSDLRIRWQWFDGSQWQALGESSPTQSTVSGDVDDGTRAFNRAGGVAFTAPLAWSAPPGEDGLWLLAEVTAGSYGSSPPKVASIAVGYDWPRPRLTTPAVTVTVARSGRRLDDAFVDGVPVDLSKDFLPFGPRPAPGATLFLGCDDAFAPARDKVTLEFDPTTPSGTGSDALVPPSALPQHNLALVWEYYDQALGAWAAIPGLSDGSVQFTVKGPIVFTPPITIGRVTVNALSRRWVRVRIAQGSYGLDKAGSAVRPPSAKSLTASYTYASGVRSPDALALENDFAVVARAPASPDPMTPFTPPADTAPTLYMGFDRPFSNQAIALYFGVRDVAAAPEGLAAAGAREPPAVIWEYWDAGAGWRRLETRDDTLAFTRRGLVTFVGPPALGESEQLGTRAYWLRARWTKGRFLRPPVLERVATSTTWARHQTTIADEVLGSATGEPGLELRAARAPVLDGQRLEVREDADWIEWEEVRDFHVSGRDDRHYVLDHLTGAVRFGDGTNGRIPPRGRENVRLALYRTGGGEKGNRPPGSLVRMLSTVPYVDAVTNAEPAAGGIEAEDAGALVERGPRTLRHGDRAVVAADFEDLAREASVEVARATAVPTARDDGSGSVGVVIVPRGDEAQPMPSAELVERVERHLRSRSAATFDLWVAGPGWLRIDVEAELVPVALERATDVDNEVRARLRAYLHPLTGGPDGTGWPLRRRVFRSDLVAVVEATPGVAYARRLALTEHPLPSTPVPGAWLVYSGEHRISMVGGD